MKIFTNKLTSFRLDDFCTEFKMSSLLTTKMCATDQKLLEFDIDQENSSLIIDDEEKQMKMEISGMNFIFSLDFDVSSDPEFLTDVGTATATVNDCTVLLNLTPKANEDGILDVSFTQAEIILKDYEVKADGATDISAALEIIFNSFKSFFKKELANMLAWRMAKSVEESMNTFMLSSEGILSIPEI